MTFPTLIDLNFNSVDLNHYPFMISRNNFLGNCNSVNEKNTYLHKCVLQVKQ